MTRSIDARVGDDATGCDGAHASPGPVPFELRIGWMSWRELRDMDESGRPAYEEAATSTMRARDDLRDTALYFKGEPHSDMCRWSTMMDAANAVHARYFAIQQAAERTFVASLPTELCGAAHAATDMLAYQSALNALLVPMRNAIVRHTHAAFFIKDVCISAEIPHTDWCGAAVLDHEPFNVVEGNFIHSLSSQLLHAGPAFCAQSATLRLAKVRQWNISLEQALSRHRSDRSLERLRDAFRSACQVKREDEPPPASEMELWEQKLAALHNQTTRMIEAQLWEAHDPDVCAGDVSTAMLIDTIGNDTSLLLSFVKATLRSPRVWGTHGVDGLHPFSISRCARPLWITKGQHKLESAHTLCDVARLLAAPSVSDVRAEAFINSSRLSK